MNLVRKELFSNSIQNYGRTAVRNRMAPGGILHHAVHGSKIDIDDPVVREFMGANGYDPIAGQSFAKENCKPKKPGRKPGGAKQAHAEKLAAEQKTIAAGEIEPSEWLNMTIRDAVQHFGTDVSFKDWASAAYKLVQIRGMEEEQARKRSEYILREHAESLVSMIDGLHKALLTDVVTNMANSAINLTKANADRNAIENDMRNTIERTIKIAKEQAIRKLRNC